MCRQRMIVSLAIPGTPLFAGLDAAVRATGLNVITVAGRRAG